MGRMMIDEEDLKRKVNSLLKLLFFGTRCFSSMLASMPKGEIVRSMNVDDIPMGKYCRNMIR